jgi:hypothetical protein
MPTAVAMCAIPWEFLTSHFFVFGERMGSRLSRSSDDCGLCRNVVTPNGDRQRYSPGAIFLALFANFLILLFSRSLGCCEKWYHQDCLSNLVNGGGTMCPHCRTPLPQNFLSTIPAANVVYAQPVSRNQTNTHRPEDPVLPWIPPTDSSIQSAMEHSNIKIECTPETYA